MGYDPPMALARKIYTPDDVEALPDDVVGELLSGEIYASPRPASRHAIAASTLGFELGSPFQRGRSGPGGWWILDEPELRLYGDILVPDLAGWRRERMPRVPDVPHFTLVPDWVCEVLSPSTLRLDRAVKMPAYARHGVKHAWIVDPVARTLEAYRLEQGRWLQLGVWSERDVAEIEPFEAVPLELAALWGED